MGRNIFTREKLSELCCIMGNLLQRAPWNMVFIRQFQPHLLQWGIWYELIRYCLPKWGYYCLFYDFLSSALQLFIILRNRLITSWEAVTYKNWSTKTLTSTSLWFNFPLGQDLTGSSGSGFNNCPELLNLVSEK